MSPIAAGLVGSCSGLEILQRHIPVDMALLAIVGDGSSNVGSGTRVVCNLDARVAQDGEALHVVEVHLAVGSGECGAVVAVVQQDVRNGRKSADWLAIVDKQHTIVLRQASAVAGLDQLASNMNALHVRPAPDAIVDGRTLLNTVQEIKGGSGADIFGEVSAPALIAGMSTDLSSDPNVRDPRVAGDRPITPWLALLDLKEA